MATAKPKLAKVKFCSLRLDTQIKPHKRRLLIPGERFCVTLMLISRLATGDLGRSYRRKRWTVWPSVAVNVAMVTRAEDCQSGCVGRFHSIPLGISSSHKPCLPAITGKAIAHAWRQKLLNSSLKANDRSLQPLRFLRYKRKNGFVSAHLKLPLTARRRQCGVKLIDIYKVQVINISLSFLCPIIFRRIVFGFKCKI